LIHHKAGYLLADGHSDELTELQWRAIPHMVALVASLENGTYKGPLKQDTDVMTVEELTKLRLEGKSPQRDINERTSVYYTEPTDVKEWVNCKIIENEK
jgi:hypothetical protein